jgi:hypothetical protein
MTPFEVLAVASIVAVTLATPAVARRSCLAKVHVPKIANASGSLTARYAGGHIRMPAPRVGAHVTSPENGPGGTCDVGDDPMIC